MEITSIRVVDIFNIQMFPIIYYYSNYFHGAVGRTAHNIKIHRIQTKFIILRIHINLIKTFYLYEISNYVHHLNYKLYEDKIFALFYLKSKIRLYRIALYYLNSESSKVKVINVTTV